MRLITVLFVLEGVNLGFSAVCRKEFEETVCENFTFTPETVLDSATNKILIKNAEGKIIHEHLSNLGLVQEIKITGSALSDIEPGALCCVPNITSFTFMDNRAIPKVTWKIFQDCQHLKKVNFDGSEVRVENGAFADARNLQTLSLNESVLPDNIEKATFEGLTSLRSLTIRHSKFTRIKEDAFDDLKNLKFLDLQGNKIETIAPNTFRGLLQLKVLNLSENKLKNLTWSEFDGLKALRVLFLEHNDFNTVNVDKLVAGVPDLERIFFSYDKLTPESRKRVEETLPKFNITFIYTGKPTD
ncbi:P-granule-associated novel protein 1-like [Tenebrio molitor]|jgi:Leucine-rich repeat (LRR) protein|uniref:Uncharacterized protein n=1 Tax=Tenebrio molitor TaxID=7067 RepID=A0A8J6HJ31_TENMO|nr:hypothetical protein GEV33_007514 [Tenebrio molitor]